MCVSKLAPVTLATNCWQSVCNNKKTLAKVAVGVSVVALAAFFGIQKLYLKTIKDCLLRVAESAGEMKNTVRGGGMLIYSDSIGSNFQCPPSYIPYQLELELSKSSVEFSGLFDQVKMLYNNATSQGLDLFTSFAFYAKRYPISEENDIAKAVFLICRSTFGSFLSNPSFSERVFMFSYPIDA